MIFESYRLDMQARGITSGSLRTYDRVTQLFQDHLAREGVSVDVAEKRHILTFLIGTGWAPRTQRTALAYLRAAYGYAVDELELMDRNPCKRVRLPRPSQTVPRTIRPDILAELSATVRDSDDALLLGLFMWTGLRTIEVRRLTWEHVSMRDNMLLVHGKRSPGQAAKQRLVPIHPQLRRLLVGRTWAHTNAHVAAGRAGDMVTAAGLHYRMKRIVGEHDIRCHDFRRTVATSLRANGCDPYVRDALMGWVRDDIFTAHYNAVSPAELQRAILLLYKDESPYPKR